MKISHCDETISLGFFLKSCSANPQEMLHNFSRFLLYIVEMHRNPELGKWKDKQMILLGEKFGRTSINDYYYLNKSMHLSLNEHYL